MQHFRPSAKQRKFLENMLDINISPKIADLCRVTGIERSTYYRWMVNEGFKSWIKYEWDKHIQFSAPLFDKIALNKAYDDFRYFKFLQDKYFSNRTVQDTSYRQSLNQLCKLINNEQAKED